MNITLDVLPYAEPVPIIWKHPHGEVVTIRGKARCNRCGHRLRINGVAPQSTRSMPIRAWHREIIDRHNARRTHG